MKLLDRLTYDEPLRALATLPAVQDGPAVVPGQIAGSDGTSPYGFGNLWSELNPDLIVPTRFVTYDQMRTEDAAVKSTLWMFKLTMRSADWSLEPASTDPVDVAICHAVAWNFGYEQEIGQMDLSSDEHHQQAFLMLDFGAMFEEIIWGDVTRWVDADGDEHLLRPISRLAPRFPITIRQPDGIVVNRRTGFIESLEQSLPGCRPIPGDKLSYYALDREGSDWYGRSMLRPMYGPWKLKRAVMISAGIGWNRYAFGTPVVRYPSDGGPSRKREAESIGRNWQTHERGWVVLEGNKNQGWDVEVVGGNSTMSDPTPLINAYNDEIAKAALQHFSSLGRTGSGSRAVAQVQVEPFYLAAQAIADHVAMQKSRLPIRRFVDENFGPGFDVPRLNVQKINARNVQVLAQAIAELATAGLSFTDPDTQNDIRDLLDMRHLPEPVQEIVDGLPPDVGIESTSGPPDPAPVVAPTPASVFPSQQKLAEGGGLGL